MEEDRVDRDETIDVLTLQYSAIVINFKKKKKVQQTHTNDFIIETYIIF